MHQSHDRAAPCAIHFDLRFLGEAHRTGAYTLRLGKRRYPLTLHTASTLAAAGSAATAGGRRPTHFAAGVAAAAGTVQLGLVYGPPNSDGFATMAAVGVVVSDGSGALTQTSYSAADIASALAFLQPEVTVLTSSAASTTLSTIANTSSVLALQAQIEAAGAGWNTPVALLDGDGKPVLGPSSGKPMCTYELASAVLNAAPVVTTEAKTSLYSEPTLAGARWNVQPGVSFVEVTGDTDAAGRSRARRALATGGGYHYNLQDGGPNFGVSAEVVGLSDDFVLDVSVTNSFCRHLSLFAGFVKGDGVRPMTLTQSEWQSLVQGDTKSTVDTFYEVLGPLGAGPALLAGGDGSIQFCDTVSPESTFLGIPVSSSSRQISFKLPDDQGPVGLIRILAGSLGVSSGNTYDPAAAWIGIAETGLIDLAVPTYSLVTGVGEESSSLFNSIFKDYTFLAKTAYSAYVAIKDLVNGSPNTGNDVASFFISLAESLVTKVLTSTEVIAKLTAVFSAEDVEESIPVVGWAMKVLALEGTVALLAQTVGELIASPRVVEFDITVTMNAEITLVPAVIGHQQPEFAATATSYTITAQYSDGTARVFSAPIPDPKVPQLVAEWEDVPVGGTVTFVVALYSAEGWLVGKGTSDSMANNLSTGQQQLTCTISVVQLLYPLDAQTTYGHSQVLVSQDGDYSWEMTTTPPSETAEDLGSGDQANTLAALTGITISEDLGILGYAYEATLDIPSIVSGQKYPTQQLYVFKNVAFGPTPDAGVMDAPAGYPDPPQLAYVLTTGAEGGGVPGFGGRPTTFYVDSTGDAGDGYALRSLAPVIDPAVPIGDPRRLFDLTQTTSWGRFSVLPTSMAVHPNGYVVGVTPSSPTLQVLRLPAAAVADADAPWAQFAAGPGTREGLLVAPTLVTIAANQTILVLEAGSNQRVQAFSRGGHPVPLFAGGQSQYWFPLVQHAAPAAVTYLALCVESKGYIYVLSRTGNGYVSADFWLDVYTPQGSLLFSQQGLTAGGLTVDLWRNLYTLNYQTILGTGGRAEPSTSIWIPSTPNNQGSAR
ncbi:hypothetical protein [Nannocystis sp. SCPEA4]|uniref:hypothetical protein n=1 Tax=Nannocystis sp. SCPEA4 TaxID=2996787 RepID=UPI0022704BD3|nr:hypothetical protein [Nannocystis sp. SCPEA4]MCY1061611.1 hypothetical protein [Nannocystis sp. SCPEA4]